MARGGVFRGINKTKTVMRISRSKIRQMIKEDFAQNEMDKKLSSQITMTLDDLIKVVIIASNAVLDNIIYGDGISESQKEKDYRRMMPQPQRELSPRRA